MNAGEKVEYRAVATPGFTALPAIYFILSFEVKAIRRALNKRGNVQSFYLGTFWKPITIS